MQQAFSEKEIACINRALNELIRGENKFFENFGNETKAKEQFDQFDQFNGIQGQNHLVIAISALSSMIGIFTNAPRAKHKESIVNQKEFPRSPPHFPFGRWRRGRQKRRKKD